MTAHLTWFYPAAPALSVGTQGGGGAVPCGSGDRFTSGSVRELPENQSRGSWEKRDYQGDSGVGTACYPRDRKPRSAWQCDLGNAAPALLAHVATKEGFVRGKRETFARSLIQPCRPFTL